MELRQSGKTEETVKYLEKIPKFIPNKIPLYMELARCYYLLGDTPKAEMYTKKISKINKKHPAVALNNAFFRIKQKKYPSVRFWYDELLKCKDLSEINPGEVLTFIETEYQKENTELAFLYSMAIVNHFLDETLISSDLEKFLSLTEDKNEYLTLRQKAIELLNSKVKR
jgi:tetratricopeptide (TPR) repeat protein